MDKILRGLTFKSGRRYLDDVVIFSENFQQHLSDLLEVYQHFRDAGLKLKLFIIRNPLKMIKVALN
jgi:hypothetical protein